MEGNSISMLFQILGFLELSVPKACVHPVDFCLWTAKHQTKETLILKLPFFLYIGCGDMCALLFKEHKPPICWTNGKVVWALANIFIKVWLKVMDQEQQNVFLTWYAVEGIVCVQDIVLHCQLIIYSQSVMSILEWLLCDKNVRLDIACKTADGQVYHVHLHCSFKICFFLVLTF